MSNDLMQAAEAVKNHARVLRSVIQLADEIERIGSIEQAATEAQQRLDKAKADEATATTELGTVNQQLADAKAVITSAEQDALNTTNDAEDKAKEIIAEANKQSDSIIAAANKRAATIGGTIATQQSALDTLNAGIDAAQKQLDTLNGSIETTKAQLRALVS